MRRILAAALLILSCATMKDSAPRRCTTTCGMLVQTNCRDAQELEDRAVYFFGKLDSRWGGPKKVCEALFGWKLKVHKYRASDQAACQHAEAWAVGTLCVMGYTHDYTKELELQNSSWLENYSAHEMVHALDITLKGTVGHCGWKEAGIKDALKKIQGGRDDGDDSQLGCP